MSNDIFTIMSQINSNQTSYLETIQTLQSLYAIECASNSNQETRSVPSKDVPITPAPTSGGGK